VKGTRRKIGRGDGQRSSGRDANQAGNKTGGGKGSDLGGEQKLGMPIGGFSPLRWALTGYPNKTPLLREGGRKTKIERKITTWEGKIEGEKIKNGCLSKVSQTRVKGQRGEPYEGRILKVMKNYLARVWWDLITKRNGRGQGLNKRGQKG